VPLVGRDLVREFTPRAARINRFTARAALRVLISRDEAPTVSVDCEGARENRGPRQTVGDY